MTDRADVLQTVDDLIALVDVKLKAAPDDPWSVIRSDYRARIAEAMTDYLATDKPSTAFRGAMRTAAIEDLPAAFWNGYAETAGEIDYTDEDAAGWIESKLEGELGFIAELFVSLKQLRDQFWHGEADTNALRDEVASRVDGYAATLESVRVAGRMWGSKNQMLTWEYGDTEHCDTCQKLNGKAHRAKWYLALDYIPGKPGAAMDCGGYRCQCKLRDKDGNVISIG